MSEVPRPRYVVDPAFPRAPSQRVWSAMSPEERLRVQRELPVHLPEHLMPPPSGDEQRRAREAEQRATDAEQRATGAEQRATDAEQRARTEAEARAEAERRLAEVEARLRALEGAPRATKPKRSR